MLYVFFSSSCLVCLKSIEYYFDYFNEFVLCVSWHRQIQGCAVSFHFISIHFFLHIQYHTNIDIDCPQRRWRKPWILWRRSVITDNWSSLFIASRHVYMHAHIHSTFIYWTFACMLNMTDKYPVGTMSSLFLPYRSFFFIIINSHLLFSRAYIYIYITQFWTTDFLFRPSFSFYTEEKNSIAKLLISFLYAYVHMQFINFASIIAIEQ